MMRMFIAGLLALAPFTAIAAACDNGSSNGVACSHVEFVGQLSAAELGGEGEVLNDLWGWVDPTTATEYVIVGMQDGTAFVRLENGGTPVFLGRLPASDGASPIAKTGDAGNPEKSCHDELCGEEDSAWRDVKVYANHAYIVSEANGHGLQIFDLTQLRMLTGEPAQPLNETAYYDGIGHAHNLFINEDTARAYIVGHDSASVAGGLHILDLSMPANPEFIAELNADGYTHDVQCVAYAGPDPDIAPGSELCFASNEDTFTVWDVSGVNTTTRDTGAKILSRTSYSHSGYTHQGWLSDDQRYFFLNDELDEVNTASRTHLRVFDVSDVHAPKLAADYFAPTLAIDHNNYVHGRWLYQSNYGAGLRILDVQDPEHPVEAAYFDPQPSDLADFYGTWSNYAFPGGLVAFSDINDGLYIARPTLQESGIAPDLAVAMTLSTDRAAPDETVDGELVLVNGSAADAADVLVTVHLRGGAEFSEPPQSDGWSCGAGAGSRVVECRASSVAADSETVFPFVVDAVAGITVDVIAMAYSLHADAHAADNLDSASFINEEGDDTVIPPDNDGGAGDSGGGGGITGWLLLMMLTAAGLRPRRLRH